MIDVERSQPPPESLIDGHGWRGEDVKARLRQDFLRKCYLCEGLLGRDFEVELIYELRCKVSRGAPYSMLIRSKLDPRLLQSLG